MSIPFQGVIETATGDLIKKGYTAFSAGPGEEVRFDLPQHARIKRPGRPGTYHNWNGSAWTTKANPTDRDGWLVIEIDANGVLTLPPSFDSKHWAVRVDTHNQASTDDLVAILGGHSGDHITLMLEAASRDVTVKDNANPSGDKIEAREGAGDMDLNQIKDKMLLVKRRGGTTHVWDEVSRSPN